MNSGNEPIIIPMSEAGERCFRRICDVLQMQRDRAEKAVSEYISENMPNARVVSECHFVDKTEYVVTVKLPKSKAKQIAYIYQTKEVYTKGAESA